MRYVLLLSFLLATSLSTFAQSPPAQTPAKPAAQTPPKTTAPPQAPPPRTGTPATPARPRTTAPAQAAGRSGLTFNVNNPGNEPLDGVHVQVTGPMERTGDTNSAGQLNFPGLPPGTYRIRFSGERVVTFEREAVLTAGKVTPVQVMLNLAEVKKEEPKPLPPPPPPLVGPVGSPQWGSLTDLAKRAQQSKPVRKEVLLACSGNSRSMLVLLTEDQPERVYDDAEATYYVLDGQGVVKIGDRPGDVTTGSFVSVPRGMPFTVTRRGNKPLVMLWTLTGARCEEAR